MLNGDIFIAKINLEGQEHRLFFEVKFQSRIFRKYKPSFLRQTIFQNYLVKDRARPEGIVHSIMMLDEVPEEWKFYEPQTITWKLEYEKFVHAWI